MKDESSQYHLPECPKHVRMEAAKMPTPLPDGCEYDGSVLKWSGDFQSPPAVGTRVLVHMNSLGAGSVVAYFIECGYIGVEVLLDKPPAWRRKQGCADDVPAMVFGAEIRPIGGVA